MGTAFSTGWSGADKNRLHKMIQNHEDSSCVDEDNEIKLMKTIRLLYDSSKAQVLSLADKLSWNEVGNDIELVNVPDSVEIPIAEFWDFHLGDRFRIKYSMRDFKRIQSKMLGWHSSLRKIHSHVGIVTECLSKYDHEIGIHIESLFFDGVIYAGLLEKISESESRNDESFSKRWCVNDYVMIGSRENDKTVAILQVNLDNIPVRYFGRKGRVVAVTKAATLVTFNERNTYKINHALLAKCSNQSPLAIPIRYHEKGFVIGQGVRVSENVKKVVKNQKDHGGWERNMSIIIGKPVRIVHIRKDGDLAIQYKTGKPWLINQDSVASLESSMSIEDDDEEIFRRGDVVKVKSHEHIRALMRINDIPTDFIEYLRIPAKISLIDDDFDYFITFNGRWKIVLPAANLLKSTSEEQVRHNEIEDMSKKIAVGSSVALDVGPSDYVNAVLRDTAFDDDVILAMTTCSTLVGFDEGGKAVIETGNGKRYRIGKKHLTVPDKFHM